MSEVASFHLPALPAADASGLVSRLEQRMAGLRSYRIEEVLRPSAVPLHTSYWFQAPDRLRYDIGGGHQTIIIGGTRYERASPAAAWSQESAVPVKVPSYPWESARATGPYVIGSDPSRGTGVAVVAFFEDSQQQPVWFRLWVDPSGLVLRAEMTTPGHFMEDDFLDHDAALLIQPPLP